MDYFQSLLQSIQNNSKKPNLNGFKFQDLFVKRNKPESATIADSELGFPTLSGGALQAYQNQRLSLPEAMRIQAGPNNFSQMLASPEVMGVAQEAPINEPYYEPTPVAPTSPIYEDPRFPKVQNFVKTYPGSRIDDEYFNLMVEKAPDLDTLMRAIAASVSETGMGKNAYQDVYNPNKEQLKNSNYWAYFVDGDRAFDPEREEMLDYIYQAFGPGGRYQNLTPERIDQYTGGDKSSNWGQIYRWAISQMQ